MPGGQRASVLDSVRRLFDSGTATGLSDRQLLDQFISSRDQSAFEAIVHRHGPMVLRVCRRALGNAHDVDDAFQATFLILIKKASSIRDRDVLANWLYGVARRVSVRAGASVRRQRNRERSITQAALANGPSDARLEQGELRRVIDDELERLPWRYRVPVVLCDLEGQTHEQAAIQLDCPVGTVKSRLARGREHLRSRLARRGLTASIAMATSVLAAEHLGATPVELGELTIMSASELAKRGAVAAVSLSPGVASLVKGVLSTMIKKKLAIVAAATVIALSVTAAAAIVLRAATPGPRDEQGGISSTGGKGTAQALPRSKQTTRNALRAALEWTTPTTPGVERFRLSNGLKVMLRPIKGANDVALVVVYGIGSDYDPAGELGLAHLIEHVYLTAAAGKARARTTEELNRRYPDGSNGQTGDRYTVISCVFPSTNLDEELADAAARMADLRITDADLEQEKPRIAEELANMFDRFPPLAAQNHARELIRPTPRGSRRLGSIDTLRTIKPERARAYWQQYYKPRNAILALAGQLVVAATRKAIEQHFSTIPPGEEPPAPVEPGKSRCGELLTVTSQASFSRQSDPVACIAYKAPAPDHDLYAPFLVLIARLWAAANKLGGEQFAGMPVYFTPVDDGAIVALSTAAKVGETAAQSIARLEKFVRETIEPALARGELAAARQQFSFLLGIAPLPDALLSRNPYGVAFSLARREQLGLDAAKLGVALGKVTDADIRRVAKEVLDPSRHAATYVSIQK
jgi:zinc protease